MYGPWDLINNADENERRKSRLWKKERDKALEIADRIYGLGGKIVMDGDRLMVHAPKNSLPPDLVDDLDRHKLKLLKLIGSQFTEKTTTETNLTEKPNPATTKNAQIRIKGNLSSLKRTGYAKLIVTQYSDSGGSYADFTIKVP